MSRATYSPIFAKRDMRAPARDKQNARLERLTRESRNLDPRRAAQLAQSILADLLAHGVGYEDFQAAAHAERQIRAARNALQKVI